MPVDFLTTEQTESYGRFTGTVAKLAMRQPFVLFKGLALLQIVGGDKLIIPFC